MTLTPEQISELERDWSHLSDREIKARCASGHYGKEQRRHADTYLEKREMKRRDRFTAKDRRIQLWILGVAIVGVLVGVVGVIATVLRP